MTDLVAGRTDDNKQVPLRVDADGNVGIISAILGAGSDRGGSITTGGTSQVVAAANATRKALLFQNTSDTDMWVNEHGSAAAVGTGWKVGPGVGVPISTNKQVSVFCATTGKTFAATES